MEVYTNGLFPATRHRVVIPEEELIRRKARQSVAFFVIPDRDERPRPVKGQEPKRPKYGKGVTALEYLRSQFRQTYGS